MSKDILDYFFRYNFTISLGIPNDNEESQKNSWSNSQELLEGHFRMISGEIHGDFSGENFRRTTSRVVISKKYTEFQNLYEKAPLNELL